MVSRLSLQELFNELAELITFKENTLAELNHIAYSLFRKIILFRDRSLVEEGKGLSKLAQSIRSFIGHMQSKIPEAIQKLNSDTEISADAKANHKSLILSTKGVNELLGLLEAIAIELTRDESASNSNESFSELKKLVDLTKDLSRETRDFIVFLQKGVDVLPPAALYTVEGHLIGVALVMIYSFVVAFNLSFIRLFKGSYEQKKFSEIEAYSFYSDILLPAFGIPAYIIMHYLSTRLTMKTSFMISIFTFLLGNVLYYVAYDTEVVWFYLIGKAIISSRLPLYGVKQFIGYHIEAKDRVKLSTCSVALYFLGLSSGYFLSIAYVDYDGSFLVFSTKQENVGGLLLSFAWTIVISFCAVLFVNPEIKYYNAGHKSYMIQGLTIVSYTLPFVVLQAFVSNHAVPTSFHWSDEKFFTFLGIFCLVALPMHLIV